MGDPARRRASPLAAGYGFKTDPREIPSPLVGKPASPFTLTTFDGRPIALAEQRGRVVVVNFWASWCILACYDEAVWTLTSGKYAMSGHVVVDDLAASDRILRDLHAVLHDRFGVEHTTIQVESRPLVQIANRDTQSTRPERPGGTKDS